jgi:mycofactocin glycosyltransferase
MNNSKNDTKIDVSIVIPCVKSPDVDNLLDSLISQETTYSYEITVIGTDDFDTLKKRCDIIFIDTTTPVSAGANRNIGIKAARGKFILFTDSDCRARQGWIQIMADKLNSGYQMVGGAFDFPKITYWQIGDNMSILHDLSETQPAGEVQFRVGGGNMALRKETLLELGGFDETFKGGQDNDLALKLLKSGGKIYFEPKSVIEHHHPNVTPKQLCAHANIYGKAIVALIERHPEFYNWEHIKKVWGKKWIFIPWSPFKAAQQATQVFTHNHQWLKYLHVWPAVWLFYFKRRMAIAANVDSLMNKEKNA